MSNDPEGVLDIRTDLSAADLTVVAVRGEVDLANAGVLEQRLVEAARRGLPVVVDLTEVDFMDSSGFRTLHRGADAATVILVVPPEGALRRVVGLAGLDGLMTVCDDVPSATEKARTSRK
jgi:anti-sigma B factor antagonist